MQLILPHTTGIIYSLSGILARSSGLSLSLICLRAARASISITTPSWVLLLSYSSISFAEVPTNLVISPSSVKCFSYITYPRRGTHFSAALTKIIYFIGKSNALNPSIVFTPLNKLIKELLSNSIRATGISFCAVNMTKLSVRINGSLLTWISPSDLKLIWLSRW